jgi:hypothetical protein
MVKNRTRNNGKTFFTTRFLALLPCIFLFPLVDVYTRRATALVIVGGTVGADCAASEKSYWASPNTVCPPVLACRQIFLILGSLVSIGGDCFIVSALLAFDGDDDRSHHFRCSHFTESGAT